MPNLPAVQNKSTLSKADQKFNEVLVTALMLGLKPNEIAKRAAPKDPKRRKALRQAIWRAIENNESLRYAIGKRAHAKLTVGIIPMADALVKRGERGRPDAIKLAFEASGFHNPRVQHEHSGDIKITLDMPRPQRVEDPDDVVDAEVVED